MDHAIEVQPAVVYCTCGQRIVDHLDGCDVVVAGNRFPFRRHTDHLICPSCFWSFRVTDLRAS